MKEMSLNKFIDDNMSLSTHECKKCKSPVELSFEPYAICIEGKVIKTNRLPQLKCIKCNHKVLTEKAKKIIVFCFDELVKTVIKHLATSNFVNILIRNAGLLYSV
ncbi:MAG: hypothetical protein WA125_10495 [Desulfosporosinus sp.]